MKWWQSGRRRFEATRPIEAKDYTGGGELGMDLLACHVNGVTSQLLGEVKASGMDPILPTLRVSIEEDYSDLTILASITAQPRRS